MKRILLGLMLTLAVACGDDEKDTSSSDGDSGSGSDGTGGDRVSDILAISGDASSGSTVYSSNCVACHAEDGSGGIGTALSGSGGAINTLSDEQIVTVILEGTTGMSAYDFLSDQDLADLFAHLKSAFGS